MSPKVIENPHKEGDSNITARNPLIDELDERSRKLKIADAIQRVTSPDTTPTDKLPELVKNILCLPREQALEVIPAIANRLLKDESGLDIGMYTASKEDFHVSLFHVRLIREMKEGESYKGTLERMLKDKDNLRRLWYAEGEKASHSGGEVINSTFLQRLTDMAELLGNEKYGLTDIAQSIRGTRDRTAEFAAKHGVAADGEAVFYRPNEEQPLVGVLDGFIHEGSHIRNNAIEAENKKNVPKNFEGSEVKLDDRRVRSIYSELRSEKRIILEDEHTIVRLNKDHPNGLSDSSLTHEGFASYMDETIIRKLGLEPQLNYREDHPLYFLGLKMWESVVDNAKEKGIGVDQLVGTLCRPYDVDGNKGLIGIVELFEHRKDKNFAEFAGINNPQGKNEAAVGLNFKSDLESQIGVVKNMLYAQNRYFWDPPPNLPLEGEYTPNRFLDAESKMMQQYGQNLGEYIDELAEVFGKEEVYGKGLGLKLPSGVSKQSTTPEIEAAIKKEHDSNKFLAEESKITQEYWATLGKYFKDLAGIFGEKVVLPSEIVLTDYGVGGSYNLKTRQILDNLYNSNGELKTPKELKNTIVHETMHLQLEKFIQDYKIPQWQKEYVVDKMIVEKFQSTDYTGLKTGKPRWQGPEGFDYHGAKAQVDPLFDKYFADGVDLGKIDAFFRELSSAGEHKSPEELRDMLARDTMRLQLEPKIQEYGIPKWQEGYTVDRMLHHDRFKSAGYDSWQHGGDSDYHGAKGQVEPLFDKYFSDGVDLGKIDSFFRELQKQNGPSVV
ncbi:MAG: hypothetical protein V1744_00995 [Candidatus Altiarchaeota archaeon]